MSISFGDQFALNEDNSINQQPNPQTLANNEERNPAQIDEESISEGDVPMEEANFADENTDEFQGVINNPVFRFKSHENVIKLIDKKNSTNVILPI